MGVSGVPLSGEPTLEVSLASPTFHAGAAVTGQVTLTAGRAELSLLRLRAHVYRRVPEAPWPLPRVALVVENDVVGFRRLPAWEAKTWDFTVSLPAGLDLGASYLVVVHDGSLEPGDLAASADFTVLPALPRAAPQLFDEEAVLLARYPNLFSEDPELQSDTLNKIYSAAMDDAASLVPLAPALLRILERSPESPNSSAAFDLWRKILTDRVRPSDLEALEPIINGEVHGESARRRMVSDATQLAGNIAASFLERLAASPSSDIRWQVAHSLEIDVPADFPNRYPLVDALSRDPVPLVRGWAANALVAFVSEPKAVQRSVELFETDPDPLVRAFAICAIVPAHQHGHLELVLSAFGSAVASPFTDVRIYAADSLRSLPSDPRVGAFVAAMLVDPEPDVRSRAATAAGKMPHYPQIEALLRRAIESDPDDHTRSQAVSGMRAFLPPADFIAFARARLAADPTEAMHWAACFLADDYKDQPFGYDFLQELGSCAIPNVAAMARAVLQMR